MNSDLKAAEATIAVMNESKLTHTSAMGTLEKKSESLKTQLQESQISERLAEQKLSSVKEQMEEMRSRLVSSAVSVSCLTCLLYIWISTFCYHSHHCHRANQKRKLLRYRLC